MALENPSTAGSLFIGGVNLFSLDDSVVLRATEFVGTIRSVLINSSQIDLGCPTDKVNIMEGKSALCIYTWSPNMNVVYLAIQVSTTPTPAALSNVRTTILPAAWTSPPSRIASV